MLFWVKLCRFVVIMRKNTHRTKNVHSYIAFWHFHSEDLPLSDVSTQHCICLIDCKSWLHCSKLKPKTFPGAWLVNRYLCLGIFMLWVFFICICWFQFVRLNFVFANFFVQMFCDLELTDCSLISCKSGLHCRVPQIP